MKKIVLFVLLITLSFPTVVFSEEPYIRLEKYPYSTHILGEDLVIYGDTNLSGVLLSLNYPDDEQNYQGISKFFITISRDELKNGYVIGTETLSRLWPRGAWTVIVQSGETRDEISIPMEEEAFFDRTLFISEYEDNTLTHTESFSVRGIHLKDNIISFTSEDGRKIRIFSWNNFVPTNKGNSTIFVTYYDTEGYITKVKPYSGNLLYYKNGISLSGDTGNNFKLLYWGKNMVPIN